MNSLENFNERLINHRDRSIILSSTFCRIFRLESCDILIRILVANVSRADDCRVRESDVQVHGKCCKAALRKDENLSRVRCRAIGSSNTIEIGKGCI